MGSHHGSGKRPRASLAVLPAGAALLALVLMSRDGDRRAQERPRAIRNVPTEATLVDAAPPAPGATVEAESDPDALYTARMLRLAPEENPLARFEPKVARMTQTLGLNEPQRSHYQALLHEYSDRLDRLWKEVDWTRPEMATAFEAAPARIQADFDRAVAGRLSDAQAARYSKLPDNERALEPLNPQPDACVARNVSATSPSPGRRPPSRRDLKK